MSRDWRVLPSTRGLLAVGVPTTVVVVVTGPRQGRRNLDRAVAGGSSEQIRAEV